MSLLREIAKNAVQGAPQGAYLNNVTVKMMTKVNGPLRVGAVTSKPPPYITPSHYLDLEVNGSIVKAPLFESPCTGLYAESSWASSKGTTGGNLNEGRAAGVVGPSVVTSSWLCDLDGVDTDCSASSAVVAADGTIYICTPSALNAVSPAGTFLWKYISGGNSTYSYPAVGSDGTVYYQDSTSLIALTPPTAPSTTPSLKWAAAIGNGDDTVPLIGCDGNIYAGTNTGLYSVNAETGVVNWSVSSGIIGGMNGWNKAIEGSTIFVNANSGVYAIDTATGSIIWFTAAISGAVYSTPSVDRTGVYFGTSTGIYKLNKSTGATIWSETSDNCNDAGAALFENLVIFSTQNSLLTAYNIATGVIEWSYGSGNNQTSPSIDGAGRIYIADYASGDLSAINAATGALVWTDTGANTGSNAYGSVAVSPAALYVGTQNGLYAVQ
jgi:outer membrane protein assembly factor BamB